MTKTVTHISGSVWLFGDHINTDLMHPPDYFSLNMETVKAGLSEGMKRISSGTPEVKKGKDVIIVAGENFGCGSSRETSVRALAAWSVRAVVARSFGRIFYRSLFNFGIYPIYCVEATEAIQSGQLLTINLQAGQIIVPGGHQYAFTPLDLHVQKVLECGGLLAYLKREILSELSERESSHNRKI